MLGFEHVILIGELLIGNNTFVVVLTDNLSERI